jgi:hypothetical protein
MLLVSAAAYAGASQQSVLRVGAVVTSSCVVRAPSAASPSLRVRCVQRQAAPILATLDRRAPVMVQMEKEGPSVIGATVALPPVRETSPARRLAIEF